MRSRAARSIFRWLSLLGEISIALVSVHGGFRSFKSRQRARSGGELRERCEGGRLELKALFRSLDRRRLLSDLPATLRTAMELDADLAEALWVLDQPKGRFDLRAMERDTVATLARIPASRREVLALLSVDDRELVVQCEKLVRPSLAPHEAYTDVPGRDPSV